MAQPARDIEIAADASGGYSTAVPPEIDRWNWGAFLLNWIGFT